MHNTIDKILEKQIHYTIIIMVGDFNAKVGGQIDQIDLLRQEVFALASAMKEFDYQIKSNQVYLYTSFFENDSGMFTVQKNQFMLK